MKQFIETTDGKLIPMHRVAEIGRAYDTGTELCRHIHTVDGDCHTITEDEGFNLTTEDTIVPNRDPNLRLLVVLEGHSEAGELIDGPIIAWRMRSGDYVFWSPIAPHWAESNGGTVWGIEDPKSGRVFVEGGWRDSREAFVRDACERLKLKAPAS
jgi:hypothetical protein